VSLTELVCKLFFASGDVLLCFDEKKSVYDLSETEPFAFFFVFVYSNDYFKQQEGLSIPSVM